VYAKRRMKITRRMEKIRESRVKLKLSMRDKKKKKKKKMSKVGNERRIVIYEDEEDRQKVR
jgi:hypothetical protein